MSQPPGWLPELAGHLAGWLQPADPVAVPMKSGYVATALTIAGIAVLELGLMPNWFLDLAVQAAQQLVA